MANAVEITSGPPPDPNLAGPYIPLMKDTIDNLSTESTRLDFGDVQIAYYNLGLGAKQSRPAPPKPSQEQVQEYFRRLVWHVTGPARHPNNSRSEAARMRKVDRCLMAIRTLQQYKYQYWDKTTRIDLQDEDRARGVADQVWDNLPDPLPDWDALSAHINNHKRNIAAIGFDYEPVGDICLTYRELEENSIKKYDELRRYLDACSASGFVARNRTGYAELGVMNFPEDGNSLWYCLAYGPPTGAGSHETWATMKFQIWNYFNHVLSHPDHPRHRLYVVLQQQSSLEIEARNPGSERLWGRMSILRALYTNKQDSGPPMYCHFRGILQVIADFFGKEVVVFTRPEIDRTMDHIRDDPPRAYDWRAYGSMDQGLDRGQILLVTDAAREQYQIAIYFEGHPEQHFDTSRATSDDRYGWIGAPWMTRPLAADYHPIHLPRAPIDDGQFTAGVESNMWYEFFGSGNAFSYDPTNNYNQGMETIFPDPQQAGWAEEQPAPPFPAPYPYPVGRHRIVTGVYTDEDGKERWPQWDNIKAYEFYNFQANAKRTGLELGPRDKSAQ
ncbi:hypothetical protein F4859DRAFT_521129 [Xylaria cf. heliscus]|nr:hypothetical protein F4859DRAFT_521129 [Xylaria cf. heliscus]